MTGQGVGPVRGGAPRWLRWLPVALLAVAVVELLVLVRVAEWLGGWTVLLLAAAAVAGVLILVRGGRSTFGRVREAARAGRPPTGELADALLTVLGGVLLVVPGFVTDVVALFCLVPPFRWLARGLLGAVLARGVDRAVRRMGAPGRGRVVRGSVVLHPVDDAGSPSHGASSNRDGDTPLIEGRVLPPDDDSRPHP